MDSRNLVSPDRGIHEVTVDWSSGLRINLKLHLPVHSNSGSTEHQYPITAAGLLQRILTAFP